MKWKGRTTSGNVSDRRVGGSKTAIGGVGIAEIGRASCMERV